MGGGPSYFRPLGTVWEQVQRSKNDETRYAARFAKEGSRTKEVIRVRLGHGYSHNAPYKFNSLVSTVPSQIGHAFTRNQMQS